VSRGRRADLKQREKKVILEAAPPPRLAGHRAGIWARKNSLETSTGVHPVFSEKEETGRRERRRRGK